MAQERLGGSGAASQVASPYVHLFDYKNQGRDWTAGQCAIGRLQSPVDLPAQAAGPAAGKFLFDYTSSIKPLELVNDANRALFVDVLGRGYGGIVHLDNWWNLISVSIKVPAEHTRAGVAWPAALNLVHKRHDDVSTVVITVPLDCATKPGGPPEPLPAGFDYSPPPTGDAAFNPVVQALLSVQPPAESTNAMAPMTSPWDLNTLFEGATFFSYAGSTTVPPCAEKVTWFVRTEAVPMSDLQGQYIYNAIVNMTGGFGNNRATRPLNGRSVLLVEAVRQPRPPPVLPVSSPVGDIPPTEREVRVMTQANEALRVAKAAVDRVKQMEKDEQAAVRAELRALTPPPAP